MPDQCLEELPLGRCEVHLSHWGRDARTFQLGIVGVDTGREGFADHVVSQINGPPSELDGLDLRPNVRAALDARERRS